MDNSLTDRRVLLGITGGIAAYKAAELVRLLRKEGAEVRVVMTDAATAFVAPLTFQALSGNPVHLRLLDAETESAMGHIELARWAELILIAPATADFIARLQAGLADDLLTTLCLAAEIPLAIAPAMNRAMWNHPATQENLAVLEGRGVRVLGPAAGSQACGETGFGRMLEPGELLSEVAALLSHGPLQGVAVLVSAGPTREPIDAVRFIGNRSSGKMGYAVASAARRAGARVTLVSGPTALPPPRGVAFVPVETTEEMYRAVLERAASHDLYIGAAAIADYRPTTVQAGKIKKAQESLFLELVRTEDVLGALGKLEDRPFLVGFAAETERLEEYARGKLAAKGLDMIAANRVGGAQGGFERDENALEVFWPGGAHFLPMASKDQLAEQLIDIIAERYHAKNPDQAAR